MEPQWLWRFTALQTGFEQQSIARYTAPRAAFAGMNRLDNFLYDDGYCFEFRLCRLEKL
jgi:hypothetical protein